MRGGVAPCIARMEVAERTLERMKSGVGPRGQGAASAQRGTCGLRGDTSRRVKGGGGEGDSAAGPTALARSALEGERLGPEAALLGLDICAGGAGSKRTHGVGWWERSGALVLIEQTSFSWSPSKQPCAHQRAHFRLHAVGEALHLEWVGFSPALGHSTKPSGAAFASELLNRPHVLLFKVPRRNRSACERSLHWLRHVRQERAETRSRVGQHSSHRQRLQWFRRWRPPRAGPHALEPAPAPGRK